MSAKRTILLAAAALAFAACSEGAHGIADVASAADPDPAAVEGPGTTDVDNSGRNVDNQLEIEKK